MNPPSQPSAIVVGAGIVGLALARALAEAGCQVSVFDRNERAIGASIRNFGTLWPIGLPNGRLYERALRSREIWREFCEASGTWYAKSGSLIAAFHQDEWDVINEYVDLNQGIRPCRILDASQTRQQVPAIVAAGLRGALLSEDEWVVDPREAIRALPNWLEQRYGVRFHWHETVTRIEHPWVWSGKRRYGADRIYIASGADFETLYPEDFERLAITKCKLQMLRLEIQAAQPFPWGPVVCGGLTMAHYQGFQATPSIERLRRRLAEQHAELLAAGIHVMAVQHARGEITIGDSHEYGRTHEPFDEAQINRQILAYLHELIELPNWRIKQSWHGIYAKLTDNTRSELLLEVEPGVTLVNGVGGGGLGMSLSFGLAEELIGGRLQAERQRP